MVVNQRYLIIGLCFMCTLICYFERVGFSIAFTTLADEQEMDESVKGGVLSAFYYGYATTQIPGGAMAAKYGGKRVLMGSYAVWSLLTMVISQCTNSTILVTGMRVAIGCAQGVFIPSLHTVLAKWIAPHERARWTSLVTSGMYLGSASAMLVLPAINRSLGPVEVLQCSGVLGLVWLVVWTRYGADLPSTGKKTNPSLVRMEEGKGHGGDKGKGQGIPWGELLRHPAVMTISVSNFSFHYALYVVMNWLPTYFQHFLHTDLSAMGNVKMLPYIMINHMDIAPKYAGVVMGISNTAGTLAGVTGVAITGVVLEWAGPDGSTRAEGWAAAMAVPAALAVLAAAHFVLFARGEKIID